MVRTRCPAPRRPNRVPPVHRACALVAGTALLSACAVGPNYRPPVAAQLNVPDSWSVPAEPTPQDLTSWWRNFDDPVLGQLVEQARMSNLDVAQAIARLRQARETVILNRAALFPALGASGGYTRGDTVKGQGFPGSDSFSLGLTASYQADIFGGTRRSVESAKAQYEGSGFSYATTLLSVESAVARNYILARTYQAQLYNARASLAIQRDNLEIAGFRVQAGLATGLDEEQARSTAATTAATIPQIQSNYNVAVSALGVLTGQAPGALKAQLAAERPIPRGPASVAADIPANLMRRRPDVRSAERSLASATAQIGVAKAALYPALSLTGSINGGASRLGNVFDILTSTLSAALSQTIFNGGRTGAQIRSARAGADGAFAAYKESVLTAMQDVENATVALQSAQERERQYIIAVTAAENAAILARNQYRSGLIDFTTLNQQEASLVTARNGLVQARSDEATGLVALYNALGGGWDFTVTPTAPPRTNEPGQG